MDDYLGKLVNYVFIPLVKLLGQFLKNNLVFWSNWFMKCEILLCERCDKTLFHRLCDCMTQV